MGFFFKPKSPRKFIYTPLYYDSRKEALDERVNRVRGEMGMSVKNGFSSRIKGELIARTSHVRRHKEATEKRGRSSAQWLIVLLVVLLLLLIYLYRN